MSEFPKVIHLCYGKNNGLFWVKRFRILLVYLIHTVFFIQLVLLVGNERELGCKGSRYCSGL